MSNELLKALQLIKEECKSHVPENGHITICDKCPLCDASRECGVLTETPKNWALEKREVYF